MQTEEVVSPVGLSDTEATLAAKRLTDLGGKVIGEVWNGCQARRERGASEPTSMQSHSTSKAIGKTFGRPLPKAAPQPNLEPV
jgi:hypothetical protein